MSKKVYKIISNQGHETTIDDSDIGRVMTESSGMLLIANKDNDIIFASSPGGWSHCYRTMIDDPHDSANPSTNVAQYDPNVYSSPTGTVTAVDDDRTVEIETGVESGSYVDRAYGEALSAVIESFQGMLDHHIAGLETAVASSDTPELLTAKVVRELRDLIDKFASGEYTLLGVDFDRPDTKLEFDEDGYAVRAIGPRRAMRVSWLARR